MATDFRELEAFRDKIQALADDKCGKFCDDCAKELAKRLLSKVIKRTPVGKTPDDLDDAQREYWAGYSGGTLRRGWTTSPINVMSNEHRIDIINQVEYASYVEYGHRQTPGRYIPALGKRAKQSWVKGQFMMTDSVKELDAQANAIVQKKLDKFLKDEGLG